MPAAPMTDPFPPPMPEDAFWALVDQAAVEGRADGEARCAALARALALLPADDILAFDGAYALALDRACTWDLWGAAALIHGGCSDDGFDYFRDWLISRGRVIYEAALADPDTLVAPARQEEAELEEYRYVAGEVYETMTGSRMPLSPRPGPETPAGEEWSPQDLPAKFPALAAAFDGPGGPLGDGVIGRIRRFLGL